MKIQHVLAQPSRHFGPVGSLLLWRGANLEIARLTFTLGLSDRSRGGTVLILIVKEILCRDLVKEVFYRELAQRSCHGPLREILDRELF